MPPSPKLKTRIRSKKSEYELQEVLNEGNMSWALRALDVHSGKTVFLKYYKSPTPAVDWYESYLRYVEEINKKLEEGSASQYCVLCTDQFKANPRPGSPNKTEYFFQIYDFIEKGLDLSGMLEEGMPWEKRKAIAKVFLVCMKKIHEAGIIHGDLKPENVQMLPSKKTALGLIPRLIDMDRSILKDKVAPWVTGKNCKEGYTGTPGYFSPEHLNGKTPQTASDVFTVGIILSQLLANKHPFTPFLGDNDKYKQAVLTGGKFVPVKLLGQLGDNTGNADQFAKLIEQCFDKDPAKRPTCAQLHKKLLELDKNSSAPTPPIPIPTPTPIPTPVPIPAPTPTAEPKVPNVLVLTGDAGTHKMRLPMSVGKVLLIKASTQANFAGTQQFKVEKDKTGWYIIPGTDERFPFTVLNDAVLTERTELKNGDKICLQGRKSGKKAMEISVTFED